MALTAEQFDQLTQLLSPAPSYGQPEKPYQGEERRVTPRILARGPAELHLAHPVVAGAERAVTVYVHDVSPGGLGLLSGTHVRSGTPVRVVITNGRDDVTVRCSVRHCTTLARGLYGVGVNVDDYNAKPTVAPDGAADEASAAWSGFFARQAAASSKGLA
jgi:hypothetical protein